jgi:type IV secretion system protein TrbL
VRKHRGLSRVRIGGILAALTVAVVVASAAPAGAQTPSPSPSASGSCKSWLPEITCNGIVQGVVNTVGGLASGNPAPVISGSIQLGNTAAAGWMRGTLGVLAGNMGDAIARAAGAIVHELDGATMPPNFPAWFMDTWGVTRNLGFQILFLCYVLAIIGGVLKANLARVVQTPVLAAVVVLGMFLVLIGVSVAVQAVDWASLQIMHGTTANVDGTVRSFGAALNVAAVTGPGSNAILGLGLLFLILIAFAIVYINLLVRKWIIYIAAGLLGLALSSSLTKAGARWYKFLAWMLAAVILSKLLLVAILAYGVSALFRPSSLTDVAGGGSVVLISAVSPWLLVGMLGMGSVRALHGGMHAAGTPLRLGRKATSTVRRTHNHWESWRRHTSTPSKAGQKKGAAAGKAAAAKGAAGGAAAGVATAGATVAASAARRAGQAAKNAPRKAAAAAAGTAGGAVPIRMNPPRKGDPAGSARTPSGLIVPKPGAGLSSLLANTGQRPAPHRGPPSESPRTTLYDQNRQREAQHRFDSMPRHPRDPK